MESRFRQVYYQLVATQVGVRLHPQVSLSRAEDYIDLFFISRPANRILRVHI